MKQLDAFETELESCLRKGWLALEEKGLVQKVLAYGLISPEGMECIEPLVFTCADARIILKDWGIDSNADLRAALVFPIAVHQGEQLRDVFEPVARLFEEVEFEEETDGEGGLRSLVENVVLRVMRRLVKEGLFGDRDQPTATVLGYFEYEPSEGYLAGHIRELNTGEWIEEWIAPSMDAPAGELHTRGKSGVEVEVSDLSLHVRSGVVVNTSWGGLVRLWDVKNLDAPIYSRSDWSKGVTAHVMSSDGRVLFTAWRDGDREFGILAFDIKTRKRHTLSIELDQACWALAFSPDQPWLIVGSATGRIEIWDCSRDCRLREWQGHSATVRDLKFSNDGKTLFSGTREDGLKAWRLGVGEMVLHLPLDVEKMMLTPDEAELVVISCDIHNNVQSQLLSVVDSAKGVLVRCIYLNPGMEEGEFEHLDHGAQCLAISDDGERLAVGVGSGEWHAHVRLLDFVSGDELGRVNVGHQHLNGVCFFPGSSDRILFTGVHHRGAQLYDWTWAE